MKLIILLVASFLCLQVVQAAVAGAGPITDLTPEWASDSDMCLDYKSCDECAAHQYCKYTASGAPTCCMRPAGSTPIENPKWASKTDICVAVVGGCDNCNVTEYSKYTPSGECLCCHRATPAAAGQPVPKISEISVVTPKSGSAGASPIAENPVPSWASSEDVCLDIKSCDDCVGVQNAYCKYADDKPTCCIKAAGVSPIIENPIPEWASESDKCASTSSCDSCERNEQQYCKYNKDGAVNCCARSTVVPTAPKSLGKKDEIPVMAGVSPIVENPIPSWASRSDLCEHVGSCDSCNSTDEQYCKYNKKGQPKCCKKSE